MVTEPPVVQPYGQVITLPLLWAHYAMRGCLYRLLEALVTCRYCDAPPGQHCTIRGTTRRAQYTHGDRWRQVAAVLDAAEPTFLDDLRHGHATWADLPR